MFILVILLIFILLAAGFFFNIALLRHSANSMGTRRKNPSNPWGAYYSRIQNGVDWLYQQKPELVEIRSYDGLRLCGYFLPANNAHTTILLMHGYRSRELYDFSCIYQYYHEHGYNLLIPWQRAHGRSEGHFICFGVKERFDCLKWIEYINNRFGMQQDIIMEGMSMGASTVLMAAGLPLPENVRGVIADCGFTSPYEIMANTMQRWKIPVHPYLDMMTWIIRFFPGIDLHTSTEDALRFCRIPLLLIHGTADRIVPPEMSQRNFNACAGEKELLLVDGAGHGFSYLVNEELCSLALERFLTKNCKQKE